jgi:hypothetical protein
MLEPDPDPPFIPAFIPLVLVKKAAIKITDMISAIMIGRLNFIS